MTSKFYRCSLAFGLLLLCQTCAFSGFQLTTKRTTSELFSGIDAGQTTTTESNSEKSRRQILKGAITTAACVGGFVEPSKATEQRCYADDPRCGADGFLRDTIPRGKPIPRVTNKITHVVQLVIDVGERREEVGFLRFGLYGDDCPKTVRTMLEFLTPVGITGVAGTDDLESEIGVQKSTVSILEGGVVPEICPSKAIEFGVPSQKKAFARARGLREAPPTFVAQNRPESVSLESEPSARAHDVAGLISIPEKGIGYASSGGDVDGAYASSFLITADGTPEFDAKLRRRVIGQVIDDESMEFLARLSSLPVKKGANGKGPPLLKVTVLDTGVQKVGANNNNNKQSKKKKK